MRQNKEHDSEKGKQKIETRNEEVETKPRVYSRKPHTRPTNKLRLGLKEKNNPKLKDTVILDEDEETVQTSKSIKKAKKQRKT